MPLLPPKSYANQAVANIFLSVKKGNKQAEGELIWQNQELYYAIAYMAAHDPQIATQLTITAFQSLFAAIAQTPARELQLQDPHWVNRFIVDACAQYHADVSTPPAGPQTDPSSDGSSQIDWETTVILGSHRVQRCVNALPEEQRQVFTVCDQLGLTWAQAATVLNQHPDNIMAWLFRARVQVVKCLGRG